MKSISLFVIVLALFSGCTTPGIDPSTPAPNTGYVDFYDSGGDKVWMVITESPSGEVTAGVRDVKNEFMRLAFAPGSHQFKVGFVRDDSNDSGPRICESPLPQIVSVDVKVGMIAPVKVEYSPIGPYIPGQAYRSFYGQLPPTINELKSGAYPAMTYTKGGYSGYRLNVTVERPIPFHRKAEMPYYRRVPFI